jgi:hypothetical protein
MSTIARFTLVEIIGAESSHASVQPWDPAAYEQPGLDTAHRILGVTMTASESQEPVAVMRRGVLRDVARQNGETWAVGDVLWAKSDGSITKTRPAAPLPFVLVGTVFETINTLHTVDVDVRVLPSLGELSGVSVETPADLDVLIYKVATHVWEPRRLVHNTDLDGLATASAHPASAITNTPAGDIAATTVQAAIDELDDEKVKVAGQLGGTADSPTVIGVTETGGPTALTFGAIGDGKFLKRDGTGIVGADAAGGATALDDLTDVDAPAPDDGDVLTWDDGNAEWIAAPPAGGPPSAHATSHVTGADQLADVVGDGGSGGTHGLVPAPAAGDAAAGKFLKATGGWAVPSATVAELDDIGDVNAAAPDDEDVLTWDDGAGAWVPAAVATIGANMRRDFQEFTAAGADSWTKPTTFTPRLVRVVVIGGGGGGGGGGGSTGAARRQGGAGGGGGAFAEAWFDADDLGSTESVYVGTGGAGGAGYSGAGSGNGNDGSVGETSTFGTTVRLSAYGGGGGYRGTAGGGNSAGVGGGGGGTGGAGATGTATTGTGGLPGGQATAFGTLSQVGGGGGAGSPGTSNQPGCSAEHGGAGGGGHTSSGVKGAGGSSLWGGGGGGDGGGTDATPAIQGGTDGGTSGTCTAGGGGAKGTDGASPTAGTDGADGNFRIAGSGGGGGGTTITATTNGANGGAGGQPGGGGGGGGACTTSATAGTGGAGGDGVVRVWTFG